MRWFWIDRFVEFVPGSRAKAVKNVTLAEEHLHDHFPGFPVMPGSLMLEGMAQTGGILLGQTSDFNEIVILAKVPNVTFHSWACPGDTLTYTATLEDVRPEGGVVGCKAHVGDRLVAEAEIVFAHLDRAAAGDSAAIDQKNFVFSMGLLGILDVGRAGDGSAPSA
ncbi:MAG TPA: 3-hydroxyacyl-ACP dehydratase FabZ family protein [Planctomycetaceae bacterium]|jgi:3-hydroxyacyl-[acyl-carrier-protein] dehydratase|nr:3-hydroxyacyl-ACP dehydratase FabZ family protein [Planctomycetaceae bacterium]